ncbi:MAG: cell envelope biogenesis protein OmpA [Alcanivorax sp.]|nr:cell envelope biogenesis protein OmpA [Alcanivorax sp.]
MQGKLRHVSLLAIGCAVAPTIAAQEAANSYVGVLGSYVRADSDRTPDSNRGGGAAVYYGRMGERGLGFEVQLSADGFETGADAGTDFYRYILGGDLVYSMGDRTSWTPFGLIGGGLSYNDVFPNDLDGYDFFLNAAIGIVTPPLFQTGQIRGRAEVRYVHDNFRDRYGDIRASLGLEIPLFGPSRVAFDVPTTETKIVEVPTGLRDSDGDGVIDERDLCPDTPPGTRVDGDGCPLDSVIDLRGVTFELDSERLRPDAETILEWAVELMERYPDMEVEIAGHTCDLGSAPYNLSLSQRRAQSVVDFMVNSGVERQRLTARGYGLTEPALPNTSEANRERNRRVEMRILN